MEGDGDWRGSLLSLLCSVLVAPCRSWLVSYWPWNCPSRSTDLSLPPRGPVTQLFLTLCDPMDCSPLGSSVHGIFQAKHWSGVPFPSSGGIKPGSPALVGGFFTAEPQGHSKICWHQQLPLNVKRVLCYPHTQRAVYHSSIQLLVSPGHKCTTLRLEVLSPLLFPAWWCY